MLEVKLSVDPIAALPGPAVVTWVFRSGMQPVLDDALAEIDRSTGGRLRELATAGELTGKQGETVLLHHPAGMKAQRLLLVGADKAERFSAVDVRTLVGTAARFLKSRGLRGFTLLVRPSPQGLSAVGAAQAAVEGVLLANLEPGRYQKKEEEERTIEELTLAGLAASDKADLEKAIRRGQVLAEAQNLAREVVNEPANRMTPRLFAERAVAAARDVGLEVDVLDENRIRELKMGAFLSVAQGSEEPPRLVVLTYAPQGWREGQPILGLVGKGVTFDSGGISIKPGEGMEKMKYDMAGGATMLGTMCALGQLKPPLKVIAVIPLTENLPSGRAQKPGDVQIAMSGKSIEVINTDAEGRLILADALHYARQLGATHVVDAATLTGAVVVALGNVNAGAFSNDQAFLDAFLVSSRAAGE